MGVTRRARVQRDLHRFGLWAASGADQRALIFLVSGSIGLFATMWGYSNCAELSDDDLPESTGRAISPSPFGLVVSWWHHLRPSTLRPTTPWVAEPTGGGRPDPGVAR